jgi:hypothetical protein
MTMTLTTGQNKDMKNGGNQHIMFCYCLQEYGKKPQLIYISHHVKTFEDIKNMTQTWPVLNTLTTFGVIMSPERGTIDWGAWYKERPIPPRGMKQWGGEFTPAA